MPFGYSALRTAPSRTLGGLGGKPVAPAHDISASVPRFTRRLEWSLPTRAVRRSSRSSPGTTGGHSEERLLGLRGALVSGGEVRGMAPLRSPRRPGHGIRGDPGPGESSTRRSTWHGEMAGATMSPDLARERTRPNVLDMVAWSGPVRNDEGRERVSWRQGWSRTAQGAPTPRQARRLIARSLRRPQQDESPLTPSQRRRPS